MGEYHCVDEADPVGDAHRSQIGQRRQETRPEENFACGRKRQTEALIQPECHHGLHDKATAKGIEGKQGREQIDRFLRFGQWRVGFRQRGRSGRFLHRRQAAISQRRQRAQQRVKQEHRLHRRPDRPSQRGCHAARQYHCERTGGREQRPDQTVTGERRGAVLVRYYTRHERMFQRQEHADITTRGIERADESDHQQRPELAHCCKPHAGGDHQQGCRQQQCAMRVAIGMQSHQQGENA